MADLKLRVDVDKSQLTGLKTELNSLKSKKIEIKVDASSIDKLSESTKNSIKLMTEFQRVTDAVKVSENNLQRSENELAAARERSKAATTNLQTEEQRYKRALEETAQSENKLATQQGKVEQQMLKNQGGMQKTANGMKDVGEAAEEAGKKTQGFISTFVKSAIIYQAIYSVRQVFLDALDTMKEVDSQLVTVRKVTQASEAEIDALRNKAYKTASEYGVGAADYLESVANFARAGYKDQSDALAELSTKTQIVGDTTAEVANQFLLSMDAAYQYEGSITKLTAVLDGANEIDNNYATSIEKIAEGLGLIAPIAAQVHMTEAELTAAIGTITATTQRSGSEAARALRALVLNIIGDTSTEIEDGVTATEESINSLMGVLKQYAPEVVAAAQATGQIIDPMEAIAALHEAMEEGLLTEQQLMEQLSALGGKLRTSQLVALVANFDMYEEMLGKYSNAVGSADREVENALNSWERKAAILGNTWTDFIQKSFDTDGIKGFIDVITKVIKLFGNLGNMILTVGGTFVALKLPNIITSFQEWRKSIQETKVSLGGMAGAVSAAQIAIAAITAAITIAVMAYNAYRQAIEEDIDAANERAEQSASEAENVYELYQTYEQAKTAYEQGKGTKDAYKAATIELAEALGIEESQIGQNISRLEEMTKAELEAAKQASQVAIKKRMDDWHEDSSYAKYGGYMEAASRSDYLFDISEKTIANAGNYLDRAKAIVKVYDDATKKQGQLSDVMAKSNKLSAEQNAEWEYSQMVIEKYGDYVEELRGNLENIKDIEGLDIDNLGDADFQGAADGLETVADKYSSLATAAGEAKTAVDEFNEALKGGEKDDTFKGMADAYEKFLTDWEAGLKGSNTVNAAIDLFFPEEVQNDLWKQGKSAGEMLASEFYQGIFTYIDENGERQFTSGEDSGSLLAYALWDDDTFTQYVSDTEKVIKLGDEVVASLKMDGDELSVTVNDFDKLSQVMYELSGVYLSPDTLAAWMQALGMYTPDLQYTTEEMKALADEVDALDGKKINLTKFVEGQLELGTPKEEVRGMVDELIRLNDEGEIELDVESGDVETARQQCADLIAEAANPLVINADTVQATADIMGVAAKTAALNLIHGTVTANVNDNASAPLGEIKTMADDLDGKIVTFTVNTITTGVKEAVGAITGKSATGTASAAGGVTLVNELGPEVIQEGATARIAGSGRPTITWVEPGARIYNALDTRQILSGVDPSLLFDGINAFAGGTASGITRWRTSTSNAKSTAAGTSVGASAGKGVATSAISNSSLKSSSSTSSSSSSSSSSEKDEELERLKDIVSLRESELDLLEAQDASVKDRINKQKQIQSAIMNEINHLKKVGGSQEEINDLYTKWYNIQKQIADLQDEMYSELQTAIKNQIDKLNEARDKEKDKIQEQIDAMKESRDTRDEQLELEEKILAVHEAEAALQNAMTERTVRYFNAVTGQWEWAANASNVKSAAESLEEAQKALEEYQDEAAYNAAIAELEAQQDAIDAKYDDLESRWDKIVESLEAPVKSIDEALQLIAKNYVSSMATDVKNLNKLLAQFGYKINTGSGSVTHSGGLPVYDNGGVLGGIGGIKATALDEMVLPPDITSKMLSVSKGNAYAARLNELRYLYGVGGSKAGVTNNSIGSQHNGDIYRFGNISLTDRQARSMTVAELARASRNLRLYSSNM